MWLQGGIIIQCHCSHDHQVLNKQRSSYCGRWVWDHYQHSIINKTRQNNLSSMLCQQEHQESNYYDFMFNKSRADCHSSNHVRKTVMFEWSNLWIQQTDDTTVLLVLRGAFSFCSRSTNWPTFCCKASLCWQISCHSKSKKQMELCCQIKLCTMEKGLAQAQPSLSTWEWFHHFLL